MSQYEQILVAVAKSMALALTGDERGEMWRIDKTPGDGLWVVHRAKSDHNSERWLQWFRPTKDQLLGYQLSVTTDKT